VDDPGDLHARVIELELRFMEQQRLTEELSSVITEQQKQIDALALRLTRLADKVAAEPGLVDRAADERPPHY
jgi:uncharacterized coiled-coil protein SlyX